MSSAIKIKVIDEESAAPDLISNDPPKTEVKSVEIAPATKKKLVKKSPTSKKITAKKITAKKKPAVKIDAEIIKTEENVEAEQKLVLDAIEDTTLIIPSVDPVKSVIAELSEQDNLTKNTEKPLQPIVESDNIHSTRSVKVYRKIAYFFIVLVLVLAVFIAYYSMVNVAITIVPNQERVSNSMIFDIYDKSSGQTENNSTILGAIQKMPIESFAEFSATGKEVIGKEVSGMAVIYNNYNKNQPLVANTRLLTPDNKLFRIKNTVNVPAGSNIEVEIYADDPSSDSAIAPTKLSIPGLWAGLQDKIYAETKENIDYKQKVKFFIQDSDIDDGTRELKQKLLADAKSLADEKYKEYDQIIYKIDESSIKSESDKNIGSEVEKFTISMKADVDIVAFNGQKTAELAKQKFLSSLSQSKELVEFDKETIVYSLNNYDSKESFANVNANFEGRISIKENAEIVEINKILGLNDQQLEAYLKGLADIAGFEVKYSPSFIKRVPKLIDRVHVEIKK